MSIHPTAIIDQDAKIAPSASIGPYSIIESDVVIGENCQISSNVRIYRGTEIGTNNRIDHGCVIGCEPQDISFDPTDLTRTIIGDDNIFREAVNISRGSSPEQATIIGNSNYLMGTFHVGHDCVIGDHNILIHRSTLAGHVTVGNHVVIAGVSAIHQFCQVGDYSMTAGCAKIVKDVPPFAVADGNPATLIGINNVGLKRAGFSTARRKAIKLAYVTLYKKSLHLEEALVKLEQSGSEDIDNIIRFYRNSKRGVTTHR